MAVKYLYIDDELDSVVKGIKKNLSSHPEKLVITHEKALEWEKQIQFIQNEIPNYDGILLDLKLEFVDGQALYHYAPALAQQLKTLIKKGSITKDFPILLCSTDDNLRKYHDKTGEDLFAECFDKMRLGSKDISKFIEHAKAYRQISDNPNNIKELLAVDSNDADILEEVSQYFERLESVHEKADFLLREVIKPTGILIDEDTLAIRLGIDNSTAKEWNDFTTLLSSCQYNGIYAHYTKERHWWMRGIFQWWQSNFPSAKPLPLLSTSEKLEIINHNLNLDLKPIILPEYHESSRLWYKCSNLILETKDATKRIIPLAESDGLTYLSPHYPWQDRNYISYNYIIVEGSQEIFKEIKSLLSPYEIEQFNQLLKLHHT